MVIDLRKKKKKKKKRKRSISIGSAYMHIIAQDSLATQTNGYVRTGTYTYRRCIKIVPSN